MECLQSKVTVLCQSNVVGTYKVAALEWYSGAHGYFEVSCPTLAVCFDNGRCQFMRTELDEGINYSQLYLMSARLHCQIEIH